MRRNCVPWLTAGRDKHAAGDLVTGRGVNANSVFRPLRTLRGEGGRVQTGIGACVSGNPTRIAVVHKAHVLLANARDHGYERDELNRLMQGLS